MIIKQIQLFNEPLCSIMSNDRILGIAVLGDKTDKSDILTYLIQGGDNKLYINYAAHGGRYETDQPRAKYRPEYRR